jgi:hypothetical protein
MCVCVCVCAGEVMLQYDITWSKSFRRDAWKAYICVWANRGDGNVDNWI